MYVEPLQLAAQDRLPVDPKPKFPAATLAQSLQATRKSAAVTEALDRTALRFTLVKPETGRLFVA